MMPNEGKIDSLSSHVYVKYKSTVDLKKNKTKQNIWIMNLYVVVCLCVRESNFRE